MLINLFSIFDLRAFTFSPVLIIVFLCSQILTTQKSFFITEQKTSILNNKILNYIYEQFKNEINSFVNKTKKIKNEGTKKFFINTILIIFLINIVSLFPIVISSTSHLSINLPMTTILWLSTIIISVLIRWTSFLAHLTPLGTPIILINFIVLIETISIIIRPITLSVRLIANIVAGHLLLILLSNFSIISLLNYFVSFPIILILGLLELGVSLIQSYVLTLLILLYFKETF